METTDEQMSKEPPVVSLATQESPPPIQFALNVLHSMTTWPDYLVDAFQRSILFLDLLPAILSSRADIAAARRFSAAAGVLYADALTRDATILLPETAE